MHVITGESIVVSLFLELKRKDHSQESEVYDNCFLIRFESGLFRKTLMKKDIFNSSSKYIQCLYYVELLYACGVKLHQINQSMYEVTETIL